MPADYTIDGYLCAADATIDQVHPRKDILLVRRIPDEEITASGVVVPDSARNPAMGVRVGEVLKCGPGDIHPDWITCLECGYGYLNGSIGQINPDGSISSAEGCPNCYAGGRSRQQDPQRIPMECQPGDRILYNRCPDNDVNIGGVDCVLLREEQHVLAILDKPAVGPIAPFPPGTTVSLSNKYVFIGMDGVEVIS